MISFCIYREGIRVKERGWGWGWGWGREEAKDCFCMERKMIPIISRQGTPTADCFP